MNQVEARARQMLEVARAGHAPSAADGARVRAKLRARVRAEPMLIEPGAPVPKPRSKLLGRWLTGFAAGGSAGFLVGFWAAQAFAPAAPRASLAPVPGENVAARAAPLPASPAPARAAAPPSSAALPSDVPRSIEPSAPELPPKSHVARATPAHRDGDTSGASQLKAELEGLRRAQELLHKGDAAWALARLDELDRAKASSVLLEERTATRVMAECVLGRATRAQVDDFAQRYPRSAHLDRVRESCARSTASKHENARTPTETQGSHHE